MRYYVFRVKIQGQPTTIVCERYTKCPLIPDHILCIGVVDIEETVMVNLKVDTISIKKSDIIYYTNCLQSITETEQTELH
jgi:hypothetical protein